MKLIADAAEVERLIAQVADQIRRGSKDPRRVALIGIRRRGDILAARLGQVMGITDVGSIDITLYRDDLSETGPMARVGKTHIPFSIQGREVVICDDVVMTGRSVLAAIREILDFGRPASLHLAVLVERPEREIPIHAEFIGVKLTPGPGEKVDVRLKGQDEIDQISINPRA